MHYTRIISLAVSVIVLLASCGGGGGGTTPEPSPEPMVNLADLRKSMAVSILNDRIIPSYDQFGQKTTAMVSALDAFSSDGSEERLNTLRQSLRDSWIAWQSAAIYQMGPTESNALRTTINVYPTKVELVEGNVSKGQWTLGTLGNRAAEGLPAVDYLLNADGVTALSLSQDAKRMAYLKDLINRVNDKSNAVATEWKSGSFATQFTSDQANGTDVGSALGLTINAMDLHLQRYLRDGKVAIPAGVRSAGVPRPTTIESLYGGYSKVLLVEAISAYIDLIRGTSGNTDKSIGAYLRAIERPKLETDILKELETSKALASGLSDSFTEQIATDNQKMVDVFLALQKVVTLLKSDIASATGISITNQDTDGD